jgi:hypothetical protein
MERTQIFGGLGVVTLLLFASIPGVSQGPSKDSVANELPRGWSLEEIEKATPPYGADGRIYVLAWKVVQDDRPLRVETCLVLKELTKESEHGRWCLAHLYRHPLEKDNTWRLPTLWVSPLPPLGPSKPVVIDHAKRFKKKPGNKEIYDSLKEVQWQFALDKDWKLVSCAVCERNWEAAIGEKATRFFGK